MCVVSMIFDMGNMYPNNWWNKDRYDWFREKVEEAKKIDEETGQPDCEDPEKVKLLERIEARLARIEAKLDIEHCECCDAED